MIESVGGCKNPKTNIEVLLNVELKTIDCIITIERFGACRRLFPVMIWFTLKKPNDKHVINVSINKISSN